MGFKTNFMNVLLGGGNQLIDTMNIQAQREYTETREAVGEANRQWNNTLADNKQANENFIAFLKYIKARPEQFSGDWDRRLSGLYQDNPGLFKGDGFDAIKDKVAKELVTYRLDTERLEEGSDNPYIPQADYFRLNQDRIRNQIGNISGMNNVMDLMTAEKEFAGGKIEIPEDIKRFTGNMATATMTAYGYGILREEPTSPYNQKLLEVEKLRIIAANAQQYGTQESKSKFLADAINKNNIDLTSIYMFNKPVTGKLLLDVFQTELKSDMLQVEKALANFNRVQAAFSAGDQAVTQETVDQTRKTYENLRNGMYVKVNNWISGTLGSTIPFDVGQVQKPEVKEEVKEEPKALVVPEGYKPQINANGEINLIDGSKVSIEEILQNKEQYAKSQPPEVMEYIDQFAPLFDADGEMIRPTRDMFAPGKVGDKLFKKFMRIYMGLNITEFIPVGPYKKEDVDQEPLMDRIKKLIQFEISESELKKIKPKKTKK